MEPDALPASDEQDREVARRLHDRTHEVELIISGAVLFALFQVPGALDAWFDGVQPRLAGSLWTAVFVSWYYTKLIVYTLIISFTLHLVGRAYWVGLIGLDSAFPEGVDWERINYGPLAKDVYRKDLVPLPAMARKADRFCSSIFAFAFWIVLVFVVSLPLAGVAWLASMGLSAALGGSPGAERIWVVAMVAAASLPLAAVGVDRLVGARLSPTGGAARTIQAVVRRSYRMLGGGLFLPVQFVLFSRVPKRAMWTLYLGVFVVLIGVFVGGEAARSGTFVPSASALLPTRPGARSVDARYFDDTRDPREASYPFIQSEIVRGPYVRLEIPLVPRRDAEALAERCADAPLLGREGVVASRSTDDPPDPAASGAVLSCLAGLWEVRLDGVPVRPDWDFRSAPGAGVTGVVAYLPTAALDPGAHLLEVTWVPATAEEGGGDDEEEGRVRRHLIRFRI